MNYPKANKLGMLFLMWSFFSCGPQTHSEFERDGMTLYVSEKHCMFCVEQEIINLNVGMTGADSLPVQIVASFSDKRILKGISARIKNRYSIEYIDVNPYDQIPTPVYVMKNANETLIFQVEDSENRKPSLDFIAQCRNELTRKGSRK